MHAAVLIDIGSTFTKARAVDLVEGNLIAAAAAATTVSDGVDVGMENAIAGLNLGPNVQTRVRLACSSAAGGLKMVAVGLTRDLTGEAARRAALGAGARVLKVYDRTFAQPDVDEIAALSPDLLLLAGGTDGGNTTFMPAAAELIGRGDPGIPVIVAGNREVAPACAEILVHEGVRVQIADNVMPELGTIAVDSVRRAVQAAFVRHITRAPGLDKAKKLVDGVVMPTPAAVLRGAEFLARGAGAYPGLGSILVVDVGGATTDVHSVGPEVVLIDGAVLKGLPELPAKRTVEGDLGVRISARSLVNSLRAERLGSLAGIDPGALQAAAEEFADQPEVLSQDQVFQSIEGWMAKFCVSEAVRRHCGRLRIRQTPAGRLREQWGKNLRQVDHVIGTGGVVVHHRNPGWILVGAAATGNVFGTGNDPDEAWLLPEAPRIHVDAAYALSAAGLLATVNPEAALRLLHETLRFDCQGE